jgi:Concanavalin A-like lectin/glucanases superfamily
MLRLRLGVWIAGLALLACDAEAHIRLLEPGASPTPAMDASRPVSEHQPEAGTQPRDAGSPPVRMPDQEPPNRVDSGQPPVATPDAGSRPTSPPEDSLVLRYDFSGDGDVVRDLVGDRHARLFGGTMLSSERTYINLDGVDDYVDIPNGVVSGLHSATFVAWLSWNGGVCWQRIFDFGISDQGEDEVGRSATSLFMTPRACGGGETFTAMAEIGPTQHRVAAEQALPRYSLQVALVVDGDSQTFILYRDTEIVGEAAMSFQLEQLTDDNNWLGRSQWAQDGFFSGSIGEFRIYSRVLSAEEIAQVRAEGFETP